MIYWVPVKRALMKYWDNFNKGAYTMKTVKILYKKHFDSYKKANQFIDSHKNVKNYVLTWDTINGKRYYSVEKWKTIEDNIVFIDDIIFNELKGGSNEQNQ